MAVSVSLDIPHFHLLGNSVLGQLDQIRELAPVSWNEIDQSWLITGHAEVLAAFRGEVPLSAQRFKLLEYLVPDPLDRDALIGNMLRYFRPFLNNLDPPEHSRLRRLMGPAFSKKVVEAYRARARAVIHEVLDELRGRHEVEFLEGVARRITGLNILRIMGFEDEADYLPRLARWAYFAVAGGSGIPTREILAQTDACAKEMADAFLPIIQKRRTTPADDFVSILVHAKDGGDQLTDDEIVANLILALLAGHDTTLNTMALSVEALSRHPDACAHMRAHPQDTLNAVMELSRYIAMSTEQTRVVAQDFEWHGCQLKQGQIAHLFVAAANRDPRVFTDPEKLDLTRDQSQSVTFGPGVHHCIGHLFAKMQLSEFFPEFLDRYESFEVLEELKFAPGIAFRGPVSLRMRLHPR
jgi:pimeloyl-[acyl-carrier protein] synthase